MPVPITRSPVRMTADPTRLITKPYLPSDTDPVAGESRPARVIERVLALPPDETEDALREVRMRFGGRHADLSDVFMRGFLAVAHLIPHAAELSDDQRTLVGAYFMHEYSIEGAALTNPSIVPAPDQSGLSDGSLRVVISLRAVGEGHLSSIEFRTGTVGPTGDVYLDDIGIAMTGQRRSPTFEKRLFSAKLDEIGARDEMVNHVLGRLEDWFTMADLEEALAAIEREGVSTSVAHHVKQVMHWLASSNYELTFPRGSEVSSRVLFPNGPTESRGMEDARLVRFTGADGRACYYATYTAFDGFNILPQLIETTDFRAFRIATLNGPAASNKGIAIFPRLIDGKFAALARSDGESNYLMVSDNVRFWHEADLIQLPIRPWELMQIGNAGSPMETEAGWLVVTHGVGPMRQYALGAILLDLDDPRQVIGHLREPLLVPTEEERDGYVPNVVYSCGSLIHADRLVIAYGASDTLTSFASVSVDALLRELRRS